MWIHVTLHLPLLWGLTLLLPQHAIACCGTLTDWNIETFCFDLRQFEVLMERNLGLNKNFALVIFLVLIIIVIIYLYKLLTYLFIYVYFTDWLSMLLCAANVNRKIISNVFLTDYMTDCNGSFLNLRMFLDTSCIKTCIFM